MIRTGVACCQLRVSIGDEPGNREQIRAAVQAAVARGARIVVLPELASSGYMFRDHAELAEAAEPVDGPSIRLLSELSREHRLVIVCGLPERGDDRLVYNSAVLVDASGVRAVYRKAHLWDNEKLVGFTPGTARPTVVPTEHGRIGMMVCYDLEFPEWVRLAALDSTDLLCAPVNWPLFPHPSGERPAEIVRVQADASVNRIAIAVADRVGVERGQQWVGGSVIVDADGYPMTDLHLGEESIAFATVDVLDSRRKSLSDHNDALGDRRPELYRPILAASGSTEPE